MALDRFCLLDRIVKRIKGYTVVVTWDAEGKVYVADVPALPGCHTWGRNVREAYRRAKDAIETYLEALRFLGEELPVEVSSKRVTSR